MTGYVVSAIVSTYANERFIEGCLKDLLRQTLGQKLEIIVIDSASPEQEGRIVKKYQESHPNIIYERTESRETLYAAWNRGIRKGGGKYIINANTDDRLRPDAYEVMAEALEKEPAIALVYGDYFITNTENQTFENHLRTGVCLRPEWTPSLMLSGCHMGPQPMWRKNLHDTLGFFNSEYRSSGDYEFWCRIATRYPMRHLNDFLGLYLHNPEGIANSNKDRASKESQKMREEYAGKLPTPLTPAFVEVYYKQPVSPLMQVNIGIVTHNNLEHLRQTLEMLIRTTDYPYTLTVVDNGSTDATPEYLNNVKRRGIIKNLSLLKESIAPAKALNLARLFEPEAEYFINLDKVSEIKNPGWLGKLVKTANQL